ncbi:MAG: transposase, partial [Richelia sp.]|nr:transposase [Richelia sp.]
MIFLGLGIAEPIPDATTVWFFRQQLKQQGL